MQHHDTVYTITEEDIAPLPDEKPGRGGGRAELRPDRRPSASMRGSGPNGARALAAATLSLFLCGAGQLYNRQGKLGALMLLTQILAGASNWAVIQLWPRLVSLADLFGVSEWNLMLGVAAADVAVLLMMLASVHQAYRFADDEAGGFAGTGNPVYSGLASLVLPGWGQLVNAQAGKAIVFLFAFLSGVYLVILTRLTPFLPLLASIDPGQILMPKVTAGAVIMVGVTGVLWIISVYDAILVAGFRRRKA